MRNQLVWISAMVLTAAAVAEDAIVRSVNLPGASLSQELTYSPSRSAFQKSRDERLKRMRGGDYSAFRTPADDPTVVVKTTATKDIRWRGVGLEAGRTYTCTYRAAEDALWMYEGEAAVIKDDERFKKCAY